jgi:hypothetical protein
VRRAKIDTQSANVRRELFHAPDGVHDAIERQLAANVERRGGSV